MASESGVETCWEEIDASYEVQMSVPNGEGRIFWRTMSDASRGLTLEGALTLKRKWNQSAPGLTLRIVRRSFAVYHEEGF